MWKFLDGYFISTADTFDKGLETMVFPSKKDARTVESIFGDVYVIGVDFGNPCDEYTRHYETVEDAKQGHKKTVELVKQVIKEKGGEND